MDCICSGGWVKWVMGECVAGSRIGSLQCSGRVGQALVEYAAGLCYTTYLVWWMGEADYG